MGYLYICYSCSDFMATCMVADFCVCDGCCIAYGCQALILVVSVVAIMPAVMSIKLLY